MSPGMLALIELERRNLKPNTALFFGVSGTPYVMVENVPFTVLEYQGQMFYSVRQLQRIGGAR